MGVPTFMRILFVLAILALPAFSEVVSHEEWLLLQKRAHETITCDAEAMRTVFSLYAELIREPDAKKEKLDRLKRLTEQLGPNCFNEGTQEEINAFFAWRGLLPCDPASIPPTLKLKFVGESHAAKPFDDAIKHFTRRATDDEIIYGIERFRPKLQDIATLKNTSNIDSDFPYQAVTLLDLWSKLHQEDAAQNYEEAGIAEPLALSIDRALWKSVARPLESNGAEDLAKLIDFHHGIRAEKPAKEEGAILTLMERSDVRLVVERVLLKLFSDLESGKRDLPYLAPNVSVMKAYYQNPASKELKEQFTELVSVQWRDRIMAANVLTLICAAATKRKDEVVIQLGIGHVPGVFRLVKEALERNKTKAPAFVTYSDYLDQPIADDELLKKYRMKFQAFLNELPAGSVKRLSDEIPLLP